MVGAEFLSGDASASPSVEPILAVARRLDAMGFGSGALSARNGLRTTTHAHTPLAMLRAEDFVEVADYDPHLDRLLCLGRREPHAFAGMHHLMLRAKKEVQAIVMVDAGAVAGSGARMGARQIDSAIAALEALRGKDAIRIGTFVLATGRSPSEALAHAEALLR